MTDAAIARGERIFPARCWTTLPDGQERGARLMRVAAAAPRLSERMTTLWHTPETRMVRLLRSLRAGVIAEMERVYERADFYFETAAEEFERLCARRRICNALSAQYGVSDIREAIARELFLETHVRFVAAYQALNGALGDRLPNHARWAERALRFASMPAESGSAVRAWLRIVETRALQRSGKPQATLAVFEAGLERQSPDYFKDAYVQTLYEQTIAALKDGDSDADKQANEKILAAALDRFLRAFDTVSDRDSAWERLADLYRRRIAAFSGNESLSACIATVQRAVDSDPFNLGIQSLDVQLRVALSEQQSEIARVEQEAAAQGKTLNEKGVALRNSLLNGFADARSYLASAQAASIQDAARTACARRLWAAIGLTDRDDWRQHGLALIDATARALLRCEREDALFASTLSVEITSNPDLRALDASMIAARLAALRGDLTQAAQPADPVVPPIVESCEPLVVADGEPVRGSEDLSDWLFSRHGLLARCSIAAAVFFVVSATALTGYSRSVESDRQALFPRVMAAARDKDEELVVDLAARFLTRRPISGRSQLDRTVEQVYAEALVNLFARTPGEPSPTLVHAAQIYRRLVVQPHEERQ